MEKYELIKHIYQYLDENQKPIDENVVPVSGSRLWNEDIVNVIDCALSGWVTEGKYASDFSLLLKRFQGSRHVRLVNSGSSANLVAFTTAVDAWREKANYKQFKIVTPAVAFPTTVTPILQNNFIPLFVDSDPRTLNPDTQTLLNALEHCEVAGIMIAHTLGFPFEADVIRQKCDELGKLFIEDSSDALGAEIEGNKVGTFGHLSTVSFFPAHHVTSLDYDEIVVYKHHENGLFSMKKIGDFVRQFEKSDGDFYVPSFDASGNIEYRKVTGVIEHPISEDLYEVTVETGRKVIVTASHSLFTKSRYEDEIISIRTSELSVGDYILVPTKLPSPSNGELFGVDIEHYQAGNWNPYTKTLEISNDVARFLGLFVAEGSFNKTSRGYSVCLTFGGDEEDYATFCLEVAKNVFGASGQIYKKKKKSAIDVRLCGKSIYNFLLIWCGKGAGNKKIPEFIFSCSEDIIRSFLGGYYDGDGNHHYTYGKHVGYSRDCKTISKELSFGLIYLFLQLGISARWSEEDGAVRDFGEYKSTTKKSYSVNYSNKSILNSRGFREDRKSRGGVGDLSLAKVVSIELVSPTTDYVYDLSINGYENFIAGNGMVVHNTGEGGAVFTDDANLYRIAGQYINWGRSCYCLPGKDNTCGKRFGHKYTNLPDGFDHKYVFEKIGYNLKMTDLQAAIGASQMTRVDSIVQQRRMHFNFLKSWLINTYDEFFMAVQYLSKMNPSPFGFPITLRKNAPFGRVELVHYLETNGIRTRPVFSGNITRHPIFETNHYDYWTVLTGADYIMNNTFWIGVHPELTSKHFERIMTVFEDFMRIYK